MCSPSAVDALFTLLTKFSRIDLLFSACSVSDTWEELSLAEPQIGDPDEFSRKSMRSSVLGFIPCSLCCALNLVLFEADLQTPT